MCWTWSRFWAVFCPIGRWTTGESVRETKYYVTLETPECMIIISDDESADEEDVPVDAHTYNVTSRGNGSATNHDMDTAIIEVPTETKGNMITNIKSQDDHSVEIEPSDVHAHFSAVMTGDINPEYRHNEIPLGQISLTRRHSPFHPDGVGASEHNRLEASTSGIDIGNSGTVKIENNPDQGDSDQGILITNVHTCNPGGSHKCTICAKQFVSRKSYKQHQSAHHRGTVHMCTICKISFPTKIGLLKHENRHKGKISFKCKECEIAFSCRRQMETHHASAHPGSKCKPFTCPTCGKSFTHQCNLNSHLWEHPGGREKCTFCGKQFTRKCMRMHLQTHNLGKRYQCTRCNMSFAFQYMLLAHQNTHTGKKPYSCEKCGDTFANSGSLHNHRHKRKSSCAQTAHLE